MSWNKNTVNLSDVPAILKLFDEIEYPYVLTELAEVYGNGLNDTDGQVYQIRKIEYTDSKGEQWVILEQFCRDCDCDMDDIIRAYKFVATNVPEDWQAFVESCSCGYCNI